MVKPRSGQSTVEYMLYLGVIVTALLAAAYVFTGPFDAGYEELEGDINTVFTEGQQQGQGDRR